jgi:predicted AAA+ superfamily ATPase
MIERHIKKSVETLLGQQPSVGLLGPRQIGKTTLALELAETMESVYLDLEDPADLAKLADPDFYFAYNNKKLIIIDEIQRRSDLFPILRSRIDKNRRAGHRTGQYLLLGSATNELLNRSSESLAGRIAYVELTGFNLLETGVQTMDQLWLRGGFPEAYLQAEASMSWRQDFIRTYLERDIPALGPRIPAATLGRFWTMLAHLHGQLFNASSIASSLDVTSPTIGRYLDLMVDLMLVRRLQPWFVNVGKRLVKSPKTYIRDSGILHTLLGIQEFNGLLSHPVLGNSWEGFVIEQLLSVAPRQVQPWFYRASGGAEIDLILEFPQGLWAIEIKRSTSPVVSKGFYSACNDIQPIRRIVVHSGPADFQITKGVEARTLPSLLEELTSLG